LPTRIAGTVCGVDPIHAGKNQNTGFWSAVYSAVVVSCRDGFVDVAAQEVENDNR
jgi:hypothetical protein